VRLVVALLLTVSAGAVCAAAAGTPRGEIHGVVKQALSGNCAEGEPCDGIARHVTLVFSRLSRTVARTATNGRGRYRLRLRPGRYTVRVASASSLRVRPSRIWIRGAGSTQIDFFVGDQSRSP
jgi:hypothetical protein